MTDQDEIQPDPHDEEQRAGDADTASDDASASADDARTGDGPDAT